MLQPNQNVAIIPERPPVSVRRRRVNFSRAAFACMPVRGARKRWPISASSVRVAGVICRAALARRPKIRYATSPAAKIVLRLLNRIFRIPKRLPAA